MKFQSAFLEKLSNTLERIPSMRNGQSLVVGVSGGADSCALLLSLLDLRRYHLTVAHYRHGLSDVEEEDTLFVASLAHRLGLPLIVGRNDTPEHQARGRSPEEAARHHRFAFLEKTRMCQGADWIALAHTADDQAETVLLRLVRGAGLEGLKGIPLCDEKRRVIHPLLWHWRAETFQLCHEANLEPRLDPTNMDAAIPRNSLRLQVIPMLEETFPGCRAAIVRTTEVLRADENLLAGLAEEAWRNSVVIEDDGFLLRQGIESLPLALSRRVLLETLHRWKGKASLAEVESLRHLYSLQPGRAATLGGGYRAERIQTGIWLPFSQGEDNEGLEVFHTPLIVPGWTFLPTGETIQAFWVPRSEVSFTSGTSFLIPAAANSEVRFWRPGDRFQPFGFSHTRKLQDYFTDRKVPVRARHRHPLLEAQGEIACIIGLEVGEHWKLTDQYSQALCLRKEKEDSHVQ
jgi:tRNA(Ile)-lysidine synthase